MIGITLIALVITIIVLLILAGVSIAMLTGENGILTQAQNAKDKTEQAEKEEMSDLDSMESLINEYTGDVKIPQVTDENPGKLEQENANTFVINSIEDLVVFSHNVRSGDKYEGQTVKLGVNLDFKSDKSYVDPDRTDYGIYGYNGNLKQLLTTGEGFIPIGSQDETNCFYGTFDGNNNVICSLYENIDRDENVRGGLFSVSYGEIKNLKLIDTNIKIKGGEVVVGGIAARCYNNIYNCHVTGNIDVTGNVWVVLAGICGTSRADNANIENCCNFANLNSNNIYEGKENKADISCGGIVAQVEGENIEINKCFNKGSMISNGGIVAVTAGGICGATRGGKVNLNNCFSTGKVESISQKNSGARITIGGIVGNNKNTSITGVYNISEIIVNSEIGRVGGIVGIADSDTVINNAFNIGEITVKDNESDIKYCGTGGIIGLLGENAENISQRQSGWSLEFDTDLQEGTQLSRGSTGMAKQTS